MSHWRSMFDNKYLGSWDLPEGRDCSVVIERVEAGVLTSQGGRSDKKPIVFFEGKSKGMALNKTNAKAVAGMYGNDTRKWAGKPIAIYVTQTSSPEGVVPCIRVRPTPPKRSRSQTNGAAHEPPPEVTNEESAQAGEEEANEPS
jgi:hypothetical protein